MAQEMDTESVASTRSSIDTAPSTSDYHNSKPIFTCLACHVAFENAENQRIHYKSDWHRYNLKRKVADLEPLSAKEFHSRVLGNTNIL